MPHPMPMLYIYIYIYKLSSFPSTSQISQFSNLLYLLLNLEFEISYPMAKIPKLRFTTEVAPAKFISITRRPLIKIMDTIDEDKTYASSKNDVNVDRRRYLLQASSPFEWSICSCIRAKNKAVARVRLSSSAKAILLYLITCCLSSSHNQPAFYGQWRCWFLLLFSFVLFCMSRVM